MIKIHGNIESASSGIDVIGNTLTPFEHIFINSGIFIDPINGQRVVLRVNPTEGTLESSAGNDDIFGSIGGSSSAPGSGLVGVNGVNFTWNGSDLVIDGASVSGLTDNWDHLAIQNISLSGLYLTQASVPVTLRSAAFGIDGTDTGSRINYNGLGAISVIVSEDTFTTDLIGAGELTVINNGGGIITFNGSIGLTGGILGDLTLDPTEYAKILYSTDGLTARVVKLTNSAATSTSGVINYNLNNVGEFLNIVAQDDISITAGDADGIGTGGNLSLNAFAGSGTLAYGFGPNEAWLSNGFPLPHSGQICQMILEKSTEKLTTNVSSTTSAILNHALATSGVLVQAFDNNTGAEVTPDTLTIVSDSQIILSFNSPFTGQIVIIG